jgi:hypothetical protein
MTFDTILYGMGLCSIVIRVPDKKKEKNNKKNSKTSNFNYKITNHSFCCVQKFLHTRIHLGIPSSLFHASLLSRTVLYIYT